MTTPNLLEIQSKTLNFLRFPLILMVVFIHNPHMDINMQSIDYAYLTASDVYSVIVILGHYTLTSLAVPCFFMFSGYLFFYNTTEFTKAQYITKLKKRLRTLLIPYLLWNMLSISVKLAFAIKSQELTSFWSNLFDKGILSIFWNYSTWTNPVTNQTFYGPVLLPLWFLRDLILTVIISPIIYAIIKHTKFIGVIMLSLLYYFKIEFEIIDYNINQLVTAMFFFSFGGYFSINSKNIVIEFRKLRNISLIISIASLVVSVYYFQTELFKYLVPIYILSGILTIVNITSSFIENKKWKENDLLSNASFFIYLAHSLLILRYSKTIIGSLIPFSDYYFECLKYLLTPLLCVSICVFIYWILNRYFPKFTSIITGGR